LSGVPVPTGELRAALDSALAERGRRASVARLERHPHAYRTSFGLEELDVTLSDGAELNLVFKDLSRESLAADALRAKPAFMHDPLREIEVYRDLLDSAGLGAPAYHGSHVDAARERYWLFIENVRGPVLWQLGDFEVWEEAARRLARLHAVLAPAAESPPASLLRYGPELYGVWIQRAREFARRPEVPWSDEARRQVEGLADRYEPVVERLAALPVTLIHGEFYPSNVLVQQRDDELRICPIDWEIAATGPSLLDLAALTIGRWTPRERDALTRAYRAAAGASPDPIALPTDFDAALECCRLHLAVQWLGWDPEWVPPAEHRHDWLAAALDSARKLGL
jgi:aminoglycoside phosphotransferase (APT) family kinase protein